MFMKITRYMCAKTQKHQQSTKEANSRAYYKLIYRSTRVKYRSKVYKMHVLALLPAIYREENYTESVRDPHCHRSRARLGMARDDSRATAHLRHAGDRGLDGRATTRYTVPGMDQAAEMLAPFRSHCSSHQLSTWVYSSRGVESSTAKKRDNARFKPASAARTAD